MSSEGIKILGKLCVPGGWAVVQEKSKQATVLQKKRAGIYAVKTAPITERAIQLCYVSWKGPLGTAGCHPAWELPADPLEQVLLEHHSHSVGRRCRANV